MSVRTLQEQIELILGKRVAEQRVGGAQSPDVEAVALFESMSLNLLLKPRAILFLMHLARNGLLKVVQDELDIIDSLKSAASDLGNPSFLVQNTKELIKARNALIQLEGLEKVNPESDVFRRFDSAVSGFLNTELSPSIRTIGRLTMKRPGEEAGIDLASDYRSLLDTHDELLERLYSLAVCVENFLESPISTLLGISTASRTRSDIEDMIVEIAAQSTAQASRDWAIRLFSNKAALSVLGSTPELYGPIISTVEELPLGHVLRCISDPAKSSVESNVGPIVLGVGAQVSITVNGTTVGPLGLPQAGFDLQDRAAIVSSVVSFPVSIPAYTYLFLSITKSDGSVVKYRCQLNGTAAPASLSKAQVLLAIDTALGADGGALEFVTSGTDRILIYANAGVGVTSDILRIELSHSEPSLSTTGVYDFYVNSAHQLLGFESGAAGTRGSTPLSLITDSLSQQFSSLVAIAPTPDGTIILESLASSIGTSMSISAPSSLGIAGTFLATSSLARFYGTVFGEDVDPVEASSVVDTSDVLEVSTGSTTILDFSDQKIVLSTALPTFDSAVVVESSLVVAIKNLDAALQSFVDGWLKGKFASDLSRLDGAIAVLGTGAAPSQIGNVTQLLNELRADVVSLQSTITSPPTLLLNGSGTEEREVVEGVMSTLIERKYDRALSYLLKAKFQEFVSLSSESASFGGELLRSMASVAQADVLFPNTSADEGQGTKGRQDSTGLS